MAGRRGSPLAILVVSMVLTALVAALVLSLLRGGGDDSDTTAITLDGDATAPQVDLTGEQAPDFEFEDLATGDTTSFHELRAGSPAVLNFFARWCAPCVEEMPGLEQVHQELGDRVTFLGLSEREPADDARDLVEQTSVTYTVGRDPSGDVLTAYAGLGMPTTILVATDGRITSSHTGRITADELRDAVQDELLT